MSSQKPIFLVGLGRSGSTILRLMLNSHPDIAIPYESHFVAKMAANEREYGDLTNIAERKALIATILSNENLKLWDHEFNADHVLETMSEQTLRGAIDAVYRDYANSKNARRWGDKSADLHRLYEINRLFPDAVFIHGIRDGRDVASSVLKLDWGPKDLIAAAEWWATNVKLGRAMGAMLPKNRYMEVRYEDLVTDSERILRKICEFLDEEYSDAMLDYHKSTSALIPENRRFQHQNVNRPPMASRAYAWKREMSKVDVVLFEKYAGEVLGELGYETNAYSCNKLRVEGRRTQIFIYRMLTQFIA